MEYKLDKVPIFSYGSTAIKDEAVFMLPINEEDENLIRCQFTEENVGFVELSSGIVINCRKIQLFGDTDNVPRGIVESNFKVDNMWNISLKKVTSRVYNTVNGSNTPKITQYYDKLSMIKYGITMLDYPEYIVVFAINVDRYRESKFYSRVIKPIIYD